MPNYVHLGKRFQLDGTKKMTIVHSKHERRILRKQAMNVLVNPMSSKSNGVRGHKIMKQLREYWRDLREPRDLADNSHERQRFIKQFTIDRREKRNDDARLGRPRRPR